MNAALRPHPEVMPLEYLRDGALALTPEQNSPLIILTDGSTSEDTVKLYQERLGREDIELHPLTQHADLLSPFFEITIHVRKKMEKWKDDMSPQRRERKSAKLLSEIQDILRAQFPQIMQRNS